MARQDKQVNLKTIAEKAGVHPSTVHRVLCNKGRISAPTRERVLTIAEELGYRPNLVARALIERRTQTLGVIVDGPDTAFVGNVLAGMEATARELGYSTLLACTHYDLDLEREHAELLLAKGVDGLLIMPVHAEASGEYYARVVAEGVPVVCVDRHLDSVETDVVATDNALGGYLAGRHLVGQGRGALGILTGSSGLPARVTAVRDRCAGFSRALGEAGRDPLIIPPAANHDTSSAEQAGYGQVREYVERGGKLDGLFAMNDSLAHGALVALQDLGIAVPQEVAVVGFNDGRRNEFLRPTLSSVRQPMREMGQEAVRVLRRRLAEGREGLPAQRILLQPILVVRGSSAPSQVLSSHTQPI